MTDCPRLRAQIEAFCPYNEQETADRLQMLQDIDTFPVLLTRDNATAHFTASCWIVNPDRTKVLMAYHNLYQSWAWTWGKTPAFTYEKTAEFARRPIRVRYEARHGLIRNAAVQSDAIDAARASALLEGARLDPALFLDVCQALVGERAAELFDIFM